VDDVIDEVITIVLGPENWQKVPPPFQFSGDPILSFGWITLPKEKFISHPLHVHSGGRVLFQKSTPPVTDGVYGKRIPTKG
jgi:hypothetical protein